MDRAVKRKPFNRNSFVSGKTDSKDLPTLRSYKRGERGGDDEASESATASSSTKGDRQRSGARAVNTGFRPGAYEMSGRAFGEIPSWAHSTAERVTNLARNLSRTISGRQDALVNDAVLADDSIVEAQVVPAQDQLPQAVVDERKVPVDERKVGKGRGLGLRQRFKRRTESLRGKFRKGKGKSKSARSIDDGSSAGISVSSTPTRIHVPEVNFDNGDAMSSSRSLAQQHQQQQYILHSAPRQQLKPPEPTNNSDNNMYPSLSAHMQRTRAPLLDDDDEEDDDEEDNDNESNHDRGAFLMASMRQHLPPEAQAPTPPPSTAPRGRTFRDEDVAEVLEVFPDARTERVQELLRQHSLTTTMITLAEESNTSTAPTATLLRQVTSRVEQSTRTNDSTATSLSRGTTFANANTYAREVIMQQVLEIFPQADPKEIEGILMEHSTYQGVAILSQKAEQEALGQSSSGKQCPSNLYGIVQQQQRKEYPVPRGHYVTGGQTHRSLEDPAALRPAAAAARLPSSASLVDDSSSYYQDSYSAEKPFGQKGRKSLIDDNEDDHDDDQKPHAISGFHPAYGRRADNSLLVDDDGANQAQIYASMQRHQKEPPSQHDPAMDASNSSTEGRINDQMAGNAFYDLRSLQ